MKSALREKAYSTRTMLICGSPKIPRTLYLGKCNTIINIWEAIFEEHLLRPTLYPSCLNGANYDVFLQHIMLVLMQGIPATVRQNMWFMHNGTPAYFMIAVLKDFDAIYLSWWIWMRWACCLISTHPVPQSLVFFLLATSDIGCLLDACEYTEWFDTTDRCRFIRNR